MPGDTGRSKTLTPQQRSQRATIAALASHLDHNARERTGPARRNTPGGITYWIQKVREERPELPDAEVQRRGGHPSPPAHDPPMSFQASRAPVRSWQNLGDPMTI